MEPMFVNPWTIDITSNTTGYPKGSKVKILLNPDGSYLVKWRISDGREAKLTPLTMNASGTLLFNDTADGFIEETHQGIFDVDILVQIALSRLSGSAVQPLRGAASTPGQLVGQWGAESTGTLPGEEEGRRPGGKPGKTAAPDGRPAAG